MSPKEAAALYVANGEHLNRLSALGRIEPADLISAHRHVRFEVANCMWSLCTPVARDVLLADAHAHVRSAARLAACAARH